MHQVTDFYIFLFYLALRLGNLPTLFAHRNHIAQICAHMHAHIHDHYITQGVMVINEILQCLSALFIIYSCVTQLTHREIVNISNIT